MKKVLKYFFLFGILLIISDCKKYEDGGIIRLARKHLFGDRKDGASKTWKLKLYEVNGIDSTQLIPGASQIPDFYERYITFKLDNKEGYTYTAETFICAYAGSIGTNYNEMIISPKMPPTNMDSAQCKPFNSTTVCTRNLLLPEGFYKKRTWEIQKLTKKEFIIVNDNLQNHYKLIFIQ